MKMKNNKWLIENAINSSKAAECIQQKAQEKEEEEIEISFDLRHKTMFTKLEINNYEKRMPDTYENRQEMLKLNGHKMNRT